MSKPNKNQPKTLDPAALSQALAKSLRKLDKTLAKQRREVVDMAQVVTRATAEVTALCRAAPGQVVALDDAIFDRLASAVRASFASLEEEADELALPELEHEAGGEGWDEELRQALTMAWQNAVEASQSLHTVAEQALTQGLSLMFSAAGDALSEKQELALDALTPSSAIPGGASESYGRGEEGGFEDPYGFSGSDEEEDEDWG